MGQIYSEWFDLIKNVGRYLMQQEDLFGNIVYTDDKPKTENQLPGNTWANLSSLNELNDNIRTCLNCPLGHTRTNFVFGVGNPKADTIFIGEAPGADEDMQGEPFVGKAGQLLNKIIEAIGMKREDVYICNILKCRPPNNRDPLPSEMEICSPYLYKQIDLIKPKFIICLGRISAQWLLQINSGLSAMRGKVISYRGASLIVTYHPAALLRNPGWKQPTWEDMKMFKALHDEVKNKI